MKVGKGLTEKLNTTRTQRRWNKMSNRSELIIPNLGPAPAINTSAMNLLYWALFWFPLCRRLPRDRQPQKNRKIDWTFLISVGDPFSSSPLNFPCFPFSKSVVENKWLAISIIGGVQWFNLGPSTLALYNSEQKDNPNPGLTT